MKHLKDECIDPLRSFDESRSRAIEQRVIHDEEMICLHGRELRPSRSPREQRFLRVLSRATNAENDELRVECTDLFKGNFPTGSARRERKWFSTSRFHDLGNPIPGDHRRVVPFFDVDARTTRKDGNFLPESGKPALHAIAKFACLLRSFTKGPKVEDRIIDLRKRSGIVVLHGKFGCSKLLCKLLLNQSFREHDFRRKRPQFIRRDVRLPAKVRNIFC